MDIILQIYAIPIKMYIKKTFSGSQYEKMGIFWSIGPPATKLLQRESYHKAPVMGLPLWNQ